MNKKHLLAIFFTVILSANLSLFAENKHTEYPEKVRFAPFYPDYLREKHSYFNTNYARLNIPFEIKQNSDGKFGMEYKYKGGVINSIPYKYDELKKCNVRGYGMFFHAKIDENESIISWSDNEVYSHKDYKLNCDKIEHSILTEYNEKNGIVLFDGRELLPPEYEIIGTQFDNSASGRLFYIVKKDNLYGVVNSDGDFIIPLSEEELSPMSLWFFKTGNGNVKNIYNEIVLTNEYNFIELNRPGFFKDYFKVCNNEDCGIIDLDGNIELPFSNKYNIFQTNKVKDGYFSVQFKDNPKGAVLVDSNGNIKTKDVFDIISGDFNNTNTFPVIKYVVDKKCEKICSLKTNEEEKEECTENCNTQYTGLIDTEGNYVFKPIAGDIDIAPAGTDGTASKDSDIFIVHTRKGKGYANGIYYKNKYLVKPRPALIKYINGVFIIPTKRDKWKTVDINGAKVPGIDKNKAYYYILTPEELIKSHGILLFHKQYAAKTLKYDETCFHITEKSNIVVKLYNKLFHKQPKTFDFCKK